MSKSVILDTPISLEKEFKIALKSIFGFSYIKLRHLNKIFGTNSRNIYKMTTLTEKDLSSITYYLPDLAIFGSDLKRELSMELDKFFALKCYRRNRLLLGLPAHGQRTHSNARTAKALKIKF
jgi:small subunit ribosomal protein S13